ncbi:universal stress protein [Pseudoxanthomonas koreensis]|uniref:universal stress protein n=1 Tax=Pseudoxanthomonas koreensis TaxID=266061 RepID=UPI0035A65D0E
MHASASGTPRRILLATDLAPRSDRALDRALQLARAWGAELVAATVVEENAAEACAMLLPDPPAWYRAEDPLHRAERLLHQAIAEHDVPVRVRVAEGDAAAQLLEIAREEGCGLVITGVARQEGLGRIVLGSTVDRIVRRCPVPVLAVRGRTHAPYQRMVVASDWSEASATAMRTGMALFPDASPVLLHGYDVPRAGLLDVARDEAIAAAAEQAQEQARVFLEQVRPPAGADSVPVVAERGDPALLLTVYAHQYPVDLAVVASRDRPPLSELVLGSTARRLLEASPVDTLMVPGPGEG